MQMDAAQMCLAETGTPHVRDDIMYGILLKTF